MLYTHSAVGITHLKISMNVGQNLANSRNCPYSHFYVSGQIKLISAENFYLVRQDNITIRNMGFKCLLSENANFITNFVKFYGLVAVSEIRP